MPGIGRIIILFFKCLYIVESQILQVLDRVLRMPAIGQQDLVDEFDPVASGQL